MKKGIQVLLWAMALAGINNVRACRATKQGRMEQVSETEWIAMVGVVTPEDPLQKPVSLGGAPVVARQSWRSVPNAKDDLAEGTIAKSSDLTKDSDLAKTSALAKSDALGTGWL